MSVNLPSIRALRCLERVVDTGSLTAAARTLNVTTGAVSRQLTALETELGTKLLERSGRGIVPTEKGRRLATMVAGAFEQIADAVQEARGGDADGTITLNGLPTIVIHWLVPRLGDLQARHPEIDLRLRTSARSERFDHPDIDAAIAVGPIEKPGFVSIPFLERSFVPVCSPSTAASLGRPILAALRKARFFYSDAQSLSWQAWFEDVGVEPIDLAANGVRFENSSLAYQAVRSGNGVALGQPNLLRNELELGALVQLFDEIFVSSLDYHLCYPERSPVSQALERLAQWLVMAGRGS